MDRKSEGLEEYAKSKGFWDGQVRILQYFVTSFNETINMKRLLKCYVFAFHNRQFNIHINLCHKQSLRIAFY